MVQRNDARVGDQRYLQAGALQNSGGFKAFFLQFKLALAAEGRPDQHRLASLHQLVDDQMALGDMVEGDVQAEFLSDAQGAEDVVGAMGVGLQRNFAADDRQQRLQLEVEGALFGGIPFRLVDFRRVALRFGQGFTQKGYDAHARLGRFSVLTIAEFDVLAEGNLHGRRRLENELVDIQGAVELDGREGTAHDVGRTRTDVHGRHAAIERQPKHLVAGIDAVGAAGLRGDRIDVFIDVVSLPADGLLAHSQVGVRVDQAGGDECVGSVIDGRFGIDVKMLTDCGDPAVVADQDFAVFNVGRGNGLDVSASNRQHVFFLLVQAVTLASVCGGHVHKLRAIVVNSRRKFKNVRRKSKIRPAWFQNISSMPITSPRCSRNSTA